MTRLHTLIRMSLALAALSLAGLLLAHLALTDIYHGEADVTLEWNIVRAAAVVFLMFIAMAGVTLVRVLRALPPARD